MPGGRPPKSIRLHMLSGAIEKNPQRFRNRQVEPQCEEPLGEPPEDWVRRAESSLEAQRLIGYWEDFRARLKKLNLGTAVDDLAVRLACQMRVRAERSDAKLGEVREYRKMLSELGLTQQGRAAFAKPKDTGAPEDGEFGEYIRPRARRSA